MKRLALFSTLASILAFGLASNAARRIDVHAQNLYSPNQTLENNNYYTLVDEPISCTLANKCVLRSVGFETQIQYNTSTPNFTKAPVRFYVDLYEGDLLIESVSLTVPKLANGTYLMGKGFNFQRTVTPTSKTHIRFNVRTGAVGNFDWPTIRTLRPKYGIGTESTVIQAVPKPPTLVSFAYNSTTQQYATQLQTTARTDGRYLDPVESPGFRATHREIKVDVDMNIYQRVYAFIDQPAVIYPTSLSSSVGVTSSFIFSFPKWGYFRTDYRTMDFEGKLSVVTPVGAKYNTYKAPSNLSGVYNTSIGKVVTKWTKPTLHSNNQPIDSANFKGYILTLRNPTTKVTEYAYKVIGYNTSSYELPNRIPNGTYELVVCGWSIENSEGMCNVSTAFAVP